MIDIDREIENLESLAYPYVSTVALCLDLLRRFKELQELVPYMVNVPTRLRELLFLDEGSQG